MTKEELDECLSRVRFPAPIIEAGPYHPIATYDGYGDPWPEWYRGARIVRIEGLSISLRVMQLDPSTNNWLEA